MGMILGKKTILIIQLFLFVSAFAQEAKPIQVIKCSDTPMSTNSIRVFVNDYIRLTKLNELSDFSSEDLSKGKYRFYITTDDCCNFIFDKTLKVTHMETQLKFDLKEADIKAINQTLLKPKLEYYANGVRIENCAEKITIPITVTVD